MDTRSIEEYTGNKHKGQDSGIGQGDSLMYRKNNRFVWQENKGNYAWRHEAHNVLMRTSLSALDNTLYGSPSSYPNNVMKVAWL